MSASEQFITGDVCTGTPFYPIPPSAMMQDGIAPTILVVDSGPTQLASVLNTLRGAGYQASGVDSFQEARHRLASIQPDLLIADIQLGAFNGLQLVLERHATHITKPSVVTHAHADPVLRREALKADAPYLVKPINPEVLLRTVEALLPPYYIQAAGNSHGRRAHGGAGPFGPGADTLSYRF